jgi:hypothetical protein
MDLESQYRHDVRLKRGSHGAGSSELSREHGDNNFDVCHTLNVTALYDLPVGKRRRYLANGGGLAQGILCGWQLGGIMNARTGIPIEVSLSRPDTVFRQRSTGRVFQTLNDNSLPGGAPISDFDAIVNTPGGVSAGMFAGPTLSPELIPI